MSGSELVIEARNLEMRYGQGPIAIHALRGVSLDVFAGEVLMVRGPSGSGKTTLLQLLGALQRPSSGSVMIQGTRTDGFSLDAMRKIRLAKVGFVFQSYNLFPTLRAWENIALALDLVGWDRATAERRARTLLGEFGMAARADAYPATLSGGERQRVAIARALSHDPPVILADEPTAALDRETGAMVTQWLQVLAHDHGRAVVVVSHDARLEPRVDRIVTIEDGCLADARSDSLASSLERRAGSPRSKTDLAAIASSEITWSV